MAKRGSQLPQIKPVGRAALNPPHPHRDADLVFIMENWPQMLGTARLTPRQAYEQTPKQ